MQRLALCLALLLSGCEAARWLDWDVGGGGPSSPPSRPSPLRLDAAAPPARWGEGDAGPGADAGSARAADAGATPDPGSATWSFPRTIFSSERLTGFGLPVTATDASGAIVALIAQNNRLFALRKAPGGAWSAPQEILDAGAAGALVDHAVAVRPDGQGVAAWARVDADGVGRLVVAFYDPARGFGEPQSLPGASPRAGHVPREAILGVDLDEAGRALVVWSEAPFGGDGDDGTILRASAYAAGGWSSPALVAELPARAGTPRFAASGRGDAIVVASDPVAVGRPNTFRAFAYRAGAGWSGPTSFSEERAAGGDVDMAPSGEALLAYGASEGGPDTETRVGIVRVRRHAPGAGWSAPVAISSRVGFRAGAVRVAVAEGDHALVAWEALGPQDTSEYREVAVTAAVHAPGIGWTAPQVVERRAPEEEVPRTRLSDATIDATGRAAIAGVRWDFQGMPPWQARTEVWAVVGRGASFEEPIILFGDDQSWAEPIVVRERPGVLGALWVDGYAVGVIDPPGPGPEVIRPDALRWSQNPTR